MFLRYRKSPTVLIGNALIFFMAGATLLTAGIAGIQVAQHATRRGVDDARMYLLFDVGLIVVGISALVASLVFGAAAIYHLRRINRKAKRGPSAGFDPQKAYTVGDDGELVEVDPPDRDKRRG